MRKNGFNFSASDYEGNLQAFFFFFFTYISQKLTENIKHDVKHLFHIYETIQFCFFQQKFCVFFHPVTTIQK